MAINFIINDPFAELPMIQAVPTQERTDPYLARFHYENTTAEGLYSPGTPQFLFWQCREAALRTLTNWERVANQPLRNWANGRVLLVRQDYGGKVVAGYDRESLLFSKIAVNGHLTFAAASTDVVAHEVGHAILDAINPRLWHTPYFEVAAFHESFADCSSLFTALGDTTSCERLLRQTPDLQSPNFMESLAEYLAKGHAEARAAGHDVDLNLTAPRRALNRLRWVDFTTLPLDGPPANLVRSAQSFSQIFTGAIYDLMRAIYFARRIPGPGGLQAAANITAKLLIEAASSTPAVPLFLAHAALNLWNADRRVNGGQNGDLIKAIFSRRNLVRAESVMMAGAEWRSTSFRRKNVHVSHRLSGSTNKELKKLLEKSVQRQRTTKAGEGQQKAQVELRREVPLFRMKGRLRGSVAKWNECAIVNPSDEEMLPEHHVTDRRAASNEVNLFVRNLISSKKLRVEQRDGSSVFPQTHLIRNEHGKKVLRRKRFVCGLS